MPWFSASSRASWVRASWSSSLSLSSAISGAQAPTTVVLWVLVRPPPNDFIISDRFSTEAPGWPGISNMPPPPVSASCSSTSLSSSSPARSFLRKLSRAAVEPGPVRASRIRSSAAASALALTPARRLSRTMERALSTRSRTIWSTSRPT
jgi:hypothetical protein